MSAVYKLMASVLFAGAAFLVVLAGVALSKLLADYQDSGPATYISAAVMELVIAFGFWSLGTWLWRSR